MSLVPVFILYICDVLNLCTFGSDEATLWQVLPLCAKCLVFSLFLYFFRFWTKRTNNFHHFVKLALTKNPKKRPTAEKLLQVTNKSNIFLVE